MQQLSAQVAALVFAQVTARISAQVKEGFADIGQKIDSLSQKLSNLSNQITGYQSLVKRQLEHAISEQESELIIRGFVEECVEKNKRRNKGARTRWKIFL